MSIPIFYSALLLTGVNLLLRFVGTSFQVCISASLGPAGVGLLQLVLSVGGLSMVAGIAGIRTATMYLTAEELGRGQKGNVPWILSGCFLYSIVCSLGIAAALYGFAPRIAAHWIADVRTVSALRLFAAFLPATCLCSVMTGYYTACNRIGTLAAVEVAEQLCAMAVTLTALGLWAGDDPGRACMAVILGSCAGAVLTLLVLVGLHLRSGVSRGPQIPVGDRLCCAALPLAAADVLRSGITTMENLMVPKRLARNIRVENPLAAFGIVSGMVFPVLMFPACILFGLAELLIPELARCAAAGSRERIRYLVRRSLKTALVYGVACAGGMYLLAQPLCLGLYQNAEAGKYLQLYALLIPMLYCDAITDAMTKGLGQQRACVVYNIVTNAMDVTMLYVLLPRYGMAGYYVSFLLTHLLNFALSLRRLTKISGETVPWYLPLRSITAGLLAVWGAGFVTRGKLAVYLTLLVCLLTLFGVVGREDARWIRGLLGWEEKRKKRKIYA